MNDSGWEVGGGVKDKAFSMRWKLVPRQIEGTGGEPRHRAGKQHSHTPAQSCDSGIARPLQYISTVSGAHRRARRLGQAWHAASCMAWGTTFATG